MDRAIDSAVVTDIEPVAPSLISSVDADAMREASRAWSMSSSPSWTASSQSSQPSLSPPTVDPDLARMVPGATLFESVAPGWLQATARATVPHSGRARFTQRVRAVLLGHPLASRELVHERLSKVKALAVLSSDALSSVAYATEQILTVLGMAGAVAYAYSLPIMAAILFLLLAVVLSYRQTIKAYPRGGGSYIVAKDNLGDTAGLIAGSALMTDYVLTVAVSVASGIDQLVSALPAIGTYRTELCIAMIVFIVLGNLRGIRESGSIFAAPTYLFLAGMMVMLATIFFRLVTGQLHSGAPQLGHAVSEVSIVLVLQAFASGCTALTGVEAISDGVPAFKPPEWVNARTTLTVMGSVLAVMFLGITVAAHVLGLAAMDPADGHYETIISQLAHSAFGASAGYVYVTVTTTAILVLAANTSFSDFPRLLYFLARDNYAPHQFKRLGDRLAFSNGIVVLGILATALVVVFRGRVDALIPLYAVGVFLAFTMSQAGMVSRWLRRREPGWARSLPLNAVGMVLTAVVFVVTGGSKLREGAWIVVLIIPALVAMFKAVHRHYAEVEGQTTTEIPTSPAMLRPICLVPIAELNAVAFQSLAMARTISSEVIAIHVCDDEEHIARMRAKWELWGRHVPLEIVESPFRSFLRPLLAYIDAIDRQRPDDTVVIVLPELVATKWWHQLLHNQTALRLKGALLFRPGTVVVNVPYHLRHGSG